MPFNDYDNIDTYALALFTEYYESLDGKCIKEQKEMREMIHAISIGPLKEWIEAQFESIIGCSTGNLMIALMNTIDWDLLRTLLKEWEEELGDE